MLNSSSPVTLLKNVIVSNVWLLTDSEGRRFLIDSGVRTERLSIKVGLWFCGVRKKGDLTALILTHRHSDHAGNAAWIREKYDCPVVCHENDAEILSGQQKPPKLKRGVGPFYHEYICGLEDKKPSVCAVDESIKTGEWKYGFHIYPAYGHTEGSILIYHEPTQTLFTGDALLAGIPPLRQFEWLGLAVPVYSLNVKQCHQYMLDFLADPPPVSTVCSGHGPITQKNAAKKINNFYQRQIFKGKTELYSV